MAAFSAGNLQSGFCRFGTFCVQLWLDLCDKARAQRITFTVSILDFVAFLAPPHLALAQVPTAAVESSEMTPTRFLQIVKGIAALGTLERIDDVARILGVELEQHSRTLWRSKKISDSALWLRSAILYFKSPPSEPNLGNSIDLELSEGTVCIRLVDILAAFPGDYFVYAGPPPSPPVMSSEAAAARRAARSDTDVSPREPGPGFSSMFVPVYQPTEGRIRFGFVPWKPCVESVSVRIPFSPTEPVGPFSFFRRVSP
jgi:hypothetical protein